MRASLLLTCFAFGGLVPAQLPVAYVSPINASPEERLEERFAAPSGAKRVGAPTASFAKYLRELPLKPSGTPVLLHNGKPKTNQGVHAAVVDISTGSRDLQQCADAVMRLRAEYLFANGREGEIAFDLTNGFRVPWERWRKGERVRVSGNACSWHSGAAKDHSHAQLLRYLEFVFTYAGTLSLSKELKDASQLPIQAGDVFIRGGSPGHAVIVLDVAKTADGRSWFLVGQSYMPAQDIHVLKNPVGTGAWYAYGTGTELRTPEWTFSWKDRKRWAE
ncbi:MAG: DUF4846 domain-containing protein [Flavobacteriales bacterium]